MTLSKSSTNAFYKFIKKLQILITRVNQKTELCTLFYLKSTISMIITITIANSFESVFSNHNKI